MRLITSYILILFCCFLFIFNSPIAEENLPSIIVGATISLEGRYSEPSMMIENAYKLWVDEVNKNNGLLGRPVKLILYDDKSNIELTQKFYKKLIEEDKVDLVLAPYGTPLTFAASQISEKHKMVMMAVGAASKKPWVAGAHYLFQL